MADRVVGERLAVDQGIPLDRSSLGVADLDSEFPPGDVGVDHELVAAEAEGLCREKPALLGRVERDEPIEAQRMMGEALPGLLEAASIPFIDVGGEDSPESGAAKVSSI